MILNFIFKKAKKIKIKKLNPGKFSKRSAMGDSPIRYCTISSE